MNSVAVITIESATFGEKPCECAGVTFWEGVFGGPLEFYFGLRGSVVNALTGEIKGFSFLGHAHRCSEIGELVEGSGKPDGDYAGCIEGEEPDAGFSFERNIGANIEFVKSA